MTACHVQCMCALISFEAAWLSGAVHCPVDVAWVGVGAPYPGVTFDLLPRPLPWPGRSPSVLFSQLMRWRTLVEWRARRRGHQCVKGCWLCGGWLAPPTNEVGCVGVWWDIIVCLSCTIGIVNFQWAFSGWSKFLEEWASLRNRMVLLWGPSFPSQLPVHWVY